ncbi:MAG: hypothetical protein K940chlam1_01001 [Candidatus Anoxychlamydiales bacterium]|nr:hypothetical protein [Candidatus Anoxychlamydiales bacterium]
MPIHLLSNSTLEFIEEATVIAIDGQPIKNFFDEKEKNAREMLLIDRTKTIAEASLQSVREQQSSRLQKQKCVRWTPSEDARILKGRSAEIPEPFKLITRSLKDRTEEAVILRWRRVLLKQYPELGRSYWKPEEDAIVLEGIKRGDSIEDIAKKLNRTEGAIAQRLIRNLMKEKAIVRGLKRKRTVSSKQAESDPWSNVPTIIAKAVEGVPMVTFVKDPSVCRLEEQIEAELPYLAFKVPFDFGIRQDQNLTDRTEKVAEENLRVIHSPEWTSTEDARSLEELIVGKPYKQIAYIRRYLVNYNNLAWVDSLIEEGRMVDMGEY